MIRRKIKFYKEINVLSISLLILLSISCKAQVIEEEEIIEPDEYILLDDIFQSEIKNRIIESQANALLKEKEVFNTRGIKDESYLNILNEAIESPYATLDFDFFNSQLSTVISTDYKNSKVNSLYFLNVQINGELIQEYDFIIIEGLNYEVDLYAFNSNKQGIRHDEIDEPAFVEFVHEFMLNIPYSFESESLFNNNVQFFTLNRISATGPNNYKVQSVVVPRMLNYQIDIFKAFFNLGE